MKKIFAIVFIVFTYQGLSIAQQTKPFVTEMTGNISFNVANRSGVVSIAEISIGDGGTGPYKAVMTGDTSLITHTIYRPSDLSRLGGEEKLPIIVWGNGGCRNGSSETRNLLSEIASHGFLVIAVGPLKYSIFDVDPNNRSMSDPKSLTAGIDWAMAQNSQKESPFYGKIDVSKVAAMGQSCGGLMALGVAIDPRVTTIVMWNSGLFASPPVMPNANNQNSGTAPRMVMPMVPKSDLKKLHCSIAYLTGGEYDIASKNAADDFSIIENVQVIHANYDFSEIVKETGYKGVGHYPATYREPNGGDFGKAGVAWLEWQLKGDEEAAKMFKGQNPGLLNNKHWTLVKKNID